MRKCLRCAAEMLEGLDIRTVDGHKLRVIRPATAGWLAKNYFGDVKAAVCPECGYLETYLPEASLARLDKIE